MFVTTTCGGANMYDTCTQIMKVKSAKSGANMRVAGGAPPAPWKFTSEYVTCVRLSERNLGVDSVSIVVVVHCC